MHFNPHTIPAIISFTLAILCGIFVITKNPKARLNRIFFFICIDIAVWMSYDFASNFNPSDELLISWYRFSYCFISFLPIMIFSFVCCYLEVPNNVLWYRINVFIGLMLSILSVSTDLIVSGINQLPVMPYPKAGELHIWLMVYCFWLVISSLKLLYDVYRTKKTTKSIEQVRMLLIAELVLSVSMFDFLGKYNVPIYPVGPFSSTTFLVIVTIAIIKHQLMDITIVIKKSIVYTLLVSVMTVIYLMAVLIFEHTFNHYFKLQAVTGSLITAIVITAIFVPLRNWLQFWVDKVFFKNTPVAIAEENELLKKEIITTEKFKAIATLASGIAHEIRNPLTAIQTFHEHLPAKKNDPAFMEKYQNIVGRESQRIAVLLQELLTFAKPAPPQKTTVNLAKLTDELLILISPKCISPLIDINKNIPADLSLQADPNQLKQALLNILLNAIDAMTNGGTLSIATKNTGQDINISITDTGCGISAQDIQHIFEPFYTRKEKGTGLGLSITQGIIEQHGGIITVESQCGIGTTFRIKIKS